MPMSELPVTVMWQARGAKGTGGMKVANLLTLRWEVVLDCLGGSNLIRRMLKSGSRRQRVSFRVL